MNKCLKALLAFLLVVGAAAAVEESAEEGEAPAGLDIVEIGHELVFETVATEAASESLEARGEAAEKVEPETVTVPPRTYYVEQAGDGLIRLSSTDDPPLFLLLPGETGSHDQDLDRPVANLVADEHGGQHIVLALPDGETLDAVGFSSVVGTRGERRLLTPRTRVNTATAQRVTEYRRYHIRPEPKFITPTERPTEHELDGGTIDHAVMRILDKATLTANACGGSYTYRNTQIFIPNAPIKKSSLGRLHYDLTNGEKEKSEHGRSAAPQRYSKIRACVDAWGYRGWRGNFASGKMLIIMKPNGNKMITTRTILEFQVKAYGLVGITWVDGWNWDSSAANSRINDYGYFHDLIMTVYLTPTYDGRGNLSYSGVVARWNHSNGLWTAQPPTGVLRSVPNLQTKIVDYARASMESIRQTTEAAFKDPSVRALFSEELTRIASGGGRPISGVNIGSDKITVTFGD